MFMNGSPQTRYEIIAETIAHDDNLLNISYLCEIAGVSRSGFYYWQRNGKKRSDFEEQDRIDFDLILIAFKHRGYDKGARGIHMRLLHQNPLEPCKTISGRILSICNHRRISNSCYRQCL